VLRLIDPLDLPENTEVEILLLRPPTDAGQSDRERGDAALIAAGLAHARLPHPLTDHVPTPPDLAAHARAIPQGTPLSDIVREGREDRC
jgi:hypothetical protein